MATSLECQAQGSRSVPTKMFSGGNDGNVSAQTTEAFGGREMGFRRSLIQGDVISALLSQCWLLSLGRFTPSCSQGGPQHTHAAKFKPRGEDGHLSRRTPSQHLMTCHLPIL